MHLWCKCWFFMSLVTLPSRIESDASSISQWAQLGRAAIGLRAWDRITLACRSASMLSISSLVNGRSMRSAWPLTQWKLNAIPLHHRTIRSWMVNMRSQLQSHFVLWKILLDVGLLSTAVTADSLSHMNRKCSWCLPEIVYLGLQGRLLIRKTTMLHSTVVKWDPFLARDACCTSWVLTVRLYV
jgi:hypothetical protein